MTTASPTANATRMLEDGEEEEAFEDYVTVQAVMLKKKNDAAEFDEKMRGLQTDDGAGQMCPEAPVGCYEDFLAGGNTWSTIDGCDKFVGENLMCDQNPEDSASTDVEESGSGLFISAAFFVWMGCA